MKFPARQAQRARNSYDGNIKSPIYFPRHPFIGAEKMRADALKSPLKLHSSQPLYKQIERDILQCLAQGEWKPGAQLPIESALAKRFGVAIYTVRAGIGELVAAGILARKQGKGTFVADHTRNRAQHRFSRVFDSDNCKVIPTREVVTSFRLQRADEQPAVLFDLARRKERLVYRWETIVELNEAPIAIRLVTVPAHLFPGLSVKVLRGNTQNLYALYQDVYGLNVVRMEDSVRAVKADAHNAKILGVKRGDPLLHIDRIAFSYNELPVEMRTRIYDGSRFHYRAERSAN
jgi:GntR family transcriptional regulator